MVSMETHTKLGASDESMVVLEYYPRFYGIFINLFLIICFYEVESTILQGELRTNKNWAFLARFCFLSEFGRFEYTIDYPKAFKTQNILLYFDEKNQWPAVYQKNKTCREKESVLIIENGQVIYLNESTFRSGCIDHPEEGKKDWLRCHNERTFESRRERYWFIAISNCDAKNGLYLEYKITMTNDHNSFWFKHFSADEFYILQIDISFLLLYIVLLLLSFIEADALRSRHLFHRTYALYLTSVILECCGLSFTCAYYANLAKEGYALMELKLLGKVIEALSTLFLLVLLILIAKGYTVTRGRLSKITYFEIFVFLFLYILVYAVLFLYEEQFFDPGKVLYIYESPVGYGIIGLRLVGWAWFVYAVTFTMIHYPEKSNFYTKLFLLYSIWFLAAPVVILVSTYVVRKWIREKLINAVELFISISAHFVFFVLTRPSKAKENFPYPVRTSQPLYVNGTRPTAPSAAQINNQNTVEQNEATTTT
ncbi:transmembrane protein 145-like [Parasteatoda tepidariorum]|uniref:transmembrane protein 145-like n=1 Tax=Parasteatoda tepidariorum TaxID=114398 RepID=UPI0039BD0137